MRAGAGKAQIKFQDGLLPVEGFTAVESPLYVRALLLECNETRAALLSVEMTSLQDYAISRLKALAAQTADLSEQAVWVGVTHTFSAPHTRSLSALKKGDANLRQKNEMLCSALEQALREALAEAMSTLQNVQLHYGEGVCTANVNRDIETPQGWWKGKNSLAFSDHTVPVVSFIAGDSKPLALLYTFDVQSNQTEGTGVISSDFVGNASLCAEERSGAVALCFAGAAADQVPADNAKAASLANAVLQASAAAKPVLTSGLRVCSQDNVYSGQELPADMHALRPDRSYSYQPAEERHSAIELLDLGGIALIGVKPELCSQTGARIRAGVQGKPVLLFTLINGGEKYMADSLSYERRTYEAMNSKFAAGSAEKLTKNIAALLQGKDKSL